ncbi:MAG: glucosaminidase domain-containing protein [bacterium]
MHKYFKNSLQALVAFPVIATTLVSPFSGTTLGSPTAAVISPDTNRPLSSMVTVNQQSADLDVKAQKIDAFFAQRKLPMVGQGKKLAAAAEKNDLPWTLIASMAVIESTAGVHACPDNKYNVFGWGSCHGEKFDSYDDAIDTVAKAVAGNSDQTKRYYEGKNLPDILETYNGSANPDYVKNTMWVMNQIEQQPIATNLSGSTNS